ncbi:HAD family hydrolase [Pontimicrobium sp. IMCC45349]|uniref:HAD family hydrolase n=1 Tax=Pontimicrobium sp. IMCC45349 TaxID=3391574 RepID=UPI0039A0EC9C
MIKTIIFDFGDVFINLDKPATERELFKLGVKELSLDMYNVAKEYEKGLISSNEFVTYFTNKFPNIKGTDLIKAWNAIILDFPEYRLEFIENLAKDKTYKLILLSNTNALHIEQVIENMNLERYNRFKNCFDKFYLSHEIHLRKPNSNIYEFVLTENNLLPNECIFIDDTKDNTDTAASLGIHVWNNNPEVDDIINLFKEKAELF